MSLRVDGSTAQAPTQAPIAGQAVIPGFDQAGKPLADDKIWEGIALPKLQDPNTADGISRKELEKLGEWGEAHATEFLQRLLADSSNGTPVVFQQRVGKDSWGVISVGVHVENGALKLAADFEMYENRARGFLDTVRDTKKPMGRPVISLRATGNIKAPDANTAVLENVGLSVSLSNLPVLSVEKLAGMDKAEAGVRRAFKDKKNDKAKLGGVLDVVRRLYGDPEKFLALLFVEMAGSGSKSGLEITVKPDEFAGKLRARFGGDAFDFTLRHVLSGKVHNDKDLDAEVRLNGSLVKTEGDAWDKKPGIQIEELAFSSKENVTATVVKGESLENAQLTANGRPLDRDEASQFLMGAFFAIAGMAGGHF